MQVDGNWLQWVPGIIREAATSLLGLLALMTLVLGLLGYVFFKGESPKIKAAMFVMMFLGVSAFGISVVRASSSQDRPDPLTFYKLVKISGDGQVVSPGTFAKFVVQVVDPKGRPIPSARILWQTPLAGSRAYVSITDAAGVTDATSMQAFVDSGQYVQTASLVSAATPVGFVEADSVKPVGPAAQFVFVVK